MRGERVARVCRRGDGRRAVQYLAIANRREIVHCGGGAGAEGDCHPGCYPSLVAGSYPRDRLESHRVEDRPAAMAAASMPLSAFGATATTMGGGASAAPALTSKIYDTVDESVAEPAACWGKARPLQPPAQPYAREYHISRGMRGLS